MCAAPLRIARPSAVTLPAQIGRRPRARRLGVATAQGLRPAARHATPGRERKAHARRRSRTTRETPQAWPSRAIYTGIDARRRARTATGPPSTDRGRHDAAGRAVAISRTGCRNVGRGAPRHIPYAAAYEGQCARLSARWRRRRMIRWASAPMSGSSSSDRSVDSPTGPPIRRRQEPLRSASRVRAMRCARHAPRAPARSLIEPDRVRCETDGPPESGSTQGTDSMC